MAIEGWQVNNFFTVFILVMILVFEKRGTRVKTGRMFVYIIICMLVLVIADSFARIGENRGGSFIILGFLGNLVMFLADPLIVLFSVIYIDCWMDEKNRKQQKIFKAIFQIFAIINIVLVLVDQILDLSGSSTLTKQFIAGAFSLLKERCRWHCSYYLSQFILWYSEKMFLMITGELFMCCRCLLLSELLFRYFTMA